MIQIEIEPDDDTDLYVQCVLRGGAPGPVPAAYSAADVLSAELWPSRGAVPLAVGLPVGWLAVNPATGAAQTGYDQGQVYASLPTALVATLYPTVTYTLKIFRRIGGAGGRRERIATALVRVRYLGI